MDNLFCENLKAARLEAKMTQKEVAEATNEPFKYRHFPVFTALFLDRNGQERTQ